jgi:hypothetical protein
MADYPLPGSPQRSAEVSRLIEDFAMVRLDEHRHAAATL